MLKSTMWVGLDAHKTFINVCVLDSAKNPMLEWRMEHTRAKVKKLARKLEKLSEGAEIRAAYEAGPCGWALQRLIQEAAPIICEVVAPSLIPIKPGKRVKTDRLDARKLADFLRAGLLTVVAPPTESQEAVRDLVRQREAANNDLGRARHRLGKFLIRRHIAWGRKNWTQMHLDWLQSLTFETAVDRAVFGDLRSQVVHQVQRKEHLTRTIEEVATHEPYRDTVGWLRCFRGIDTVTAMTVLAEIFDFQRFDSAKKLMSYLGLTPSEYTSGIPKRGGITKAGNTRARKILIESAQHSRNMVRISRPLRVRRENQPQEVIALADKAMKRLHTVYWRLVNRGKHHNTAVTACARELVGFIWALLHPSGVGVRATGL